MQFSLKALMIVVTGLCIGLAAWPANSTFVLLGILAPLAVLPTILDAVLAYRYPRQNRQRLTALLLFLAPLMITLQFAPAMNTLGILRFAWLLLWVLQIVRIANTCEPAPEPNDSAGG